MLRTLRAPPTAGSIRESVLLLALMQEENIEHAKLRAMAQIQLDKTEGVKAFEEYMKIAFPYLETQKKRDKESVMAQLKREISRGALAVRSMVPPPMKSRLKTQAHTSRLRTAQERNDIYGKLRKTNG